MKIWNQSSKDNDSAIDYFLSSEDIVLDQELFLYDIQASIAHAHELQAINILTKSETKKIIASLKKLAKLFQTKKFKLTSKYEDCHSAIEQYLTKELRFSWKRKFILVEAEMTRSWLPCAYMQEQN